MLSSANLAASQAATAGETAGNGAAGAGAGAGAGGGGMDFSGVAGSPAPVPQGPLPFPPSTAFAEAGTGAGAGAEAGAGAGAGAEDRDRDRDVLNTGDLFRLRSVKFPEYELGITSKKISGDRCYLGLHKAQAFGVEEDENVWCHTTRFSARYSNTIVF